LPNGLTVLLSQDNELPLVSGSLYIRAGSLWEPAEPIGAAAALGDLMRQGGAGARSADALDEALEKLSASVSSSMGGEFGTVSFGALAPDFEAVFGIAADVLLRPRFEESRVELWRSQSLEAIRRRPDDPWNIAGISFAQLLFGTSSYGKVSVSADVQAISVPMLRALHQRFIRPDGAILAITGAVSRVQVEQLVARYLGGWTARGNQIGPLPPVDFTPVPGVYFVSQPTTQASVYIGQQGVPRLTPDYPAIDGFNQIFGSGLFSSRLVKKVRAELGLAYSIGGGISPGPVKGRNFIAFQTKGPSAGEAIDHSLQELKRLQSEPVSAEELSEMQRAVANSFIFRFETPDKAIVRRASQELLGYPSDYDETYLGKIRSLEPKDIQGVAKRRWDISKLVVIVVGDETAYSSVEKMLADPASALSGARLLRREFRERLL
jgi:zinc protease